MKKNFQGDKSHYKNFILALNEENYAEANKYLNAIVTDKIKQKIAKASDIKLF